MNQLLLLQKRALRCITNSRYNSHTETLFKDQGILMINDLYEYQVATFMFSYEQAELPISFRNVFKHNRDINTTYDTRHSYRMYIPRYTSRFSNDLPCCAYPRIWNKWNIYMNDIKSKVNSKVL